MQFFVVITQMAYAHYTDCDYDKRVEWSCVIYLSSLFILFMNFFICSYTWGSSQHQRKGVSGDAHQSSVLGNGQLLYSRTVEADGGIHNKEILFTAKKDNWHIFSSYADVYVVSRTTVELAGSKINAETIASGINVMELLAWYMSTPYRKQPDKDISIYPYLLPWVAMSAYVPELVKI